VLPITRVLVIDDSVRARRVLSRVLAREPTVEVVAAMGNSHAAVVRADALRPDVVLLDAEIAGADGCATLAELKRRHPELRAVMRGDERELSEDRVRLGLLPAIRGLGGRPAGTLDMFEPGRAEPGAVEAIVVAASTGGPDALEVLLSRLPPVLNLPVFVVQHMPAEFTRILADRLNRRSALTVQEASDGELVTAGHVYVARGSLHMALATVESEVRVALNDGQPENSCRPAADVLFRSAAAVYGDKLIAVVLTGMGRDGLLGAEAVRRAGGCVIAQSEDSSVIASMPGAVAAAGLANAVVDLESIGDLLVKYAGRGH
jgi:two-component system chemotaxis response regulator CheB